LQREALRLQWANAAEVFMNNVGQWSTTVSGTEEHQIHKDDDADHHCAEQEPLGSAHDVTLSRHGADCIP
jgi:hypothetical protein